MAKGINRTDTIPAILRADGGTAECKCTVALVTKLTPGTSSNAVATCLCIDSAEQSPPDGNYRLDVRGRIFKVRREGGQWPVVNL
jgi:hypothetical protein